MGVQLTLFQPKEGRLCPPHYRLPTRIWKSNDISARNGLFYGWEKLFYWKWPKIFHFLTCSCRFLYPNCLQFDCSITCIQSLKTSSNKFKRILFWRLIWPSLFRINYFFDHKISAISWHQPRIFNFFSQWRFVSNTFRTKIPKSSHCVRTIFETKYQIFFPLSNLFFLLFSHYFFLIFPYQKKKSGPLVSSIGIHLLYFNSYASRAHYSRSIRVEYLKLVKW